MDDATRKALLSAADFGSDVAEKEIQQLSKYFVQTGQWKRVRSGDVDVIYGQKGSGKSAIYYLLDNEENSFLDEHILLAPAENIKADPAFSEIKKDAPPTTEEFACLWKLYLCSVAALRAKEIGIDNDDINHVISYLKDLMIVDGRPSLNSILKMTFDYVKAFFRASSVEGTVNIDPNTGTPIGFGGRIVFSEPSFSARKVGAKSIKDIMDVLDRAMGSYGYKMWLLLDRLDVAFSQSEELESRALRSLFEAYNDMHFDNIKLKIFMRTDIWERISKEGFREATHVGNLNGSVFLEWDENILFSLMMRRILNNDHICEYFAVSREEAMSSFDLQKLLFQRMVPNKSISRKHEDSFRWIYSRLSDGKEICAPRELIQLISAARNIQLEKLENGQSGPKDDALFDRTTFLKALEVVSTARMEKTIFAEYPRFRPHLDMLRGKRTTQTSATLANIWNTNETEANRIASELHLIGIFERPGQGQTIYRVPFLYRSALQMVQGAEVASGVSDADGDEL